MGMWVRKHETYFLLYFGLRNNGLTTFVLLELFPPSLYNAVATKCLRDCTEPFFFPLIINPFTTLSTTPVELALLHARWYLTMKYSN